MRQSVIINMTAPIAQLTLYVRLSLTLVSATGVMNITRYAMVTRYGRMPWSAFVVKHVSRNQCHTHVNEDATTPMMPFVKSEHRMINSAEQYCNVGSTNLGDTRTMDKRGITRVWRMQDCISALSDIHINLSKSDNLLVH